MAMDAQPTTSTLEDQMPLLDKEPTSPKCWERHQCTIISALLLAICAVAVVVHSMTLSRAEVILSEKPLSDQRSYQFSRLPNGLHMLNIQDAHSRKMAMAMGVRAGSYDDPRELPGLAHFCEHMLFLGTEKYPQPSGFDNFLTKYGGSSNAFTASEATVYFAAAAASAAAEGLDRFADFFRAPLFKKEFVKKEVQAINSEHQKNVQSNVRRIFELLQQQANPESVVGRFHTGDMETLYNAPQRNGTSPVEALKVYFKQRYCPAQMRLVTFGPQSLSEQVNMVAQAGFADLPPGDGSCAEAPRRRPVPEAFPAARMGKSLLVQGTEAIGSLWLHFQMPALDREYKAQPLTYLNYVMDYGGENSLKRVLTDNLGLISNVRMEEQTDSTGTMAIVAFETTEKGFQQSQAILDVFFGYVAAMRAAGVDMQLYQSLQDMVKLQWDWKQSDDAFETVSNLAEVMTRLPHDKLLSGDSLIERPDPELLSSMLTRVEPGNMNVVQVAPSGLGPAPLKATKQPIRTLEHYGAKYVSRAVEEVFPHAKTWSSWLGADQSKVTEELKEFLRAAGVNVTEGDLTLPPRLPSKIEGIPAHVNLDYMSPTSLAMRGSASTERLYGPAPVRLSLDAPLGQRMIMMDSPNSTAEDVWFRSGWTMKDPKAHVAVGLRRLQSSLPPEETAFDSVRFKVYEKLLAEVMAPQLFDLTTAGSTYAVEVGHSGMTLDFVSFGEALPTLIQKVLESFNRFNRELPTQKKRFERVLGTYVEELETYGDMPAAYAGHDMERLLMRNHFSNEERLAALKGLNRSTALRTAGELLLSQSLRMTALAIGNLGDGASTKAVHQVASLLQRPSWVSPQPAPGKDAYVEEVSPVVHVKRPIEVRTVNPRPNDPNDVAHVSIIYGVSDIPSRVILGVASSLVGTAAFDNLRTQQQLGYVVGGGMTTLSNVLIMRVVVQGTKVNADEAEAAIEGLLTSTMPKILRELTVDDFKSQVNAYRQQILEPPLAASDEVEHFWGHITQGGRCMDLLDKVLKFMESPECSKQLLLDTWNDMIFGKGGLRKKVAVKYFSSKGNQKAPARMSLEDARKLWASHGVAPDAMSLMSKEWGETKVVETASSKERQELIQEGGYFPQDLHCGSTEGHEETQSIMRQVSDGSGGEPLLHTQHGGKAFRRPKGI